MRRQVCRRPQIELFSQVPGARVRKAFLLTCARRGLARVRRRVEEVNIVLINGREMARLQRVFLGKRGTTDVLAFDLSDSPRGAISGDVYICLDQARRQAREYGVPLYMELGRLAAHGALHLTGMRDDTEAERRRMRRWEDRILHEACRS